MKDDNFSSRRRTRYSIKNKQGSQLFSTKLCLLICFIWAICQPINAQIVLSPNQSLKVNLVIDSVVNGYGQPKLKIYKEENSKQELVNTVSLGIKTKGIDLVNQLKIESIGPEEDILERYEMISGKRRFCENNAKQRSYVLKNPQGKKLVLNLRVFNDGVAFQYQINGIVSDTLLYENTSYLINDTSKKWIHAYKNDYEDFYDERNENISGEWSYPLLIENNSSLYTLLTEANITRDNASSRLSNSNQSDVYQVKLGQEELPISAGWTSPWRLMIIGSLAEIVESTLVTDVSEANTLKDISWIEPGNVAWIYWAFNNSSSDFQKVNEYTDLAAKMNWKYNLIDWKWDAMANGGNVVDAINYANSKGVKPLLWYNSGTGWIGEGAPGPLDRLLNADRRKEEFEWLNKIGVAGIKIDFFLGDDASMMAYYIDLLKDAAAYNLMVNFHGSTAPRGWSRTYPNLMTMEAVYGAEWYNNNATLTPKAAKHNATLPFTRNVIGSMDYTPGTFSDSQHKHITSHAHELALMIAFESAWQHRPDRPSVYYALPTEVKELLTTLPTAWDDTKLLSGYPGEDIIIARRKGKTWYVAGLNGTDQAKTLVFNPSQLSTSIAKSMLIKDGNDMHEFLIEEGSVEPVSIQCLPRGGFVSIIEMK